MLVSLTRLLVPSRAPGLGDFLHSLILLEVQVRLDFRHCQSDLAAQVCLGLHETLVARHSQPFRWVQYHLVLHLRLVDLAHQANLAGLVDKRRPSR